MYMKIYLIWLFLHGKTIFGMLKIMPTYTGIKRNWSCQESTHTHTSRETENEIKNKFSKHYIGKQNKKKKNCTNTDMDIMSSTKGRSRGFLTLS